MDDAFALFHVLWLADPQLVERPEGGEDAAAHPRAEPSLNGRSRSKDLGFGLDKSESGGMEQLGHAAKGRGSELTAGIRRDNSADRRSVKPGRSVVPPTTTMLLLNAACTSTSQARIAVSIISGMLAA